MTGFAFMAFLISVETMCILIIQVVHGCKFLQRSPVGPDGKILRIIRSIEILRFIFAGVFNGLVACFAERFRMAHHAVIIGIARYRIGKQFMFIKVIRIQMVFRFQVCQVCMACFAVINLFISVMACITGRHWSETAGRYITFCF